MVEEINKFLVQEGWQTLTQWVWIRTFQLPGRQLIINGQPMSEPGKSIELKIEYIGEGMISGSDREDSIYGFRIMVPQEEDLWCLNEQDFMFWYRQLIR